MVPTAGPTQPFSDCPGRRHQHQHTPLAPERSMPSSKGQAIACSAAMRARSGPLAVAVPIMARPGSPITVRTSSKSTFTAVVVDDLGNAADSIFQHIVGLSEGIVLQHFRAQHVDELLVQHNDERIDVRLNSDRPSSAFFMPPPPSQSKGLGPHPR